MTGAVRRLNRRAGREVDEIWISAKMRQIATLEREGQPDWAAFLRRVLGLWGWYY